MIPMPRGPHEIFEAHERALGRGDLEQLAADYSDDCIQIANGQTRRGKSGVKEGFAQIFSELGHVREMQAPIRVFEDDVLYVEWWADMGDRRCDGADTFVFKDGLITVQTITYQVMDAASPS